LFRCLSNHVEHLGGFGEFLIGQQQGELFGGQFLSMADQFQWPQTPRRSQFGCVSLN